MPRTEPRTLPNRQTWLRIAKTFSFTLGIVVSGKAVQRYLDRRNRNEHQRILDHISVKIALFPALLPTIYETSMKLLPGRPAIPELLASSSLLLLPVSWRKQLALYASFSALLHSLRKLGWSKRLPPLWTMYIAGNAWLLWTFVFNSDAFPKAYTRVVISNSTRYVPPGTTNKQISDILTRPSTPIADRGRSRSRLHHNSQCATLHPNEPSCLKNCIRSCVFESAKVGRWIGIFVALSLILTRRRRARLRATPTKVLLEWLLSSTRGTAFIVGSVTSAWALNCASQRSSFTNNFPHTRWLTIGSMASLWILALPRKRRDEIAFYVARLAALSAWDTWRLNGGESIPYGDCALFALSWARIVSLKKSGEEITGVVGMALNAVDRI